MIGFSLNPLPRRNERQIGLPSAGWRAQRLLKSVLLLAERSISKNLPHRCSLCVARGVLRQGATPLCIPHFIIPAFTHSAAAVFCHRPPWCLDALIFFQHSLSQSEKQHFFVFCLLLYLNLTENSCSHHYILTKL